MHLLHYQCTNTAAVRLTNRSEEKKQLSSRIKVESKMTPGFYSPEGLVLIQDPRGPFNVEAPFNHCLRWQSIWSESGRNIHIWRDGLKLHYTLRWGTFADFLHHFLIIAEGDQIKQTITLCKVRTSPIWDNLNTQLNKHIQRWIRF